MASDKADYTKFLTEVIKRHIIIFGPYITLMKAKKVVGLTVSETGEVLNIKGVLPELSTKLLEEFSTMSASVTNATVKSVLSNFPNIKLDNY